MDIRENIASVRERIKSAAKRAGRDPGSITLVTVTKEASEAQVREAVAAGERNLGENRVQDALSKRKAVEGDVSWHMIGHLQTNKVKDAVKIFNLIHSVDSLKLAEKIDDESAKAGKKQDILIEVNTSGEKSKFGILPGELESFLDKTHNMKNVNVKGLMTMAPLSDNAENSRPFFRRLKELAEKNKLRELSMGMTQDFEVAIEEDATMVRIGSAILK